MSELVAEPMFIGAVVGLGIGILLEKGRFCFVSAFRDFFAYKDDRVLQGVLVGILAMMAGVGFAYYLGAPDERFWIPTFGLSGLIGGFIFGVGMTVNGGCVSGTFYRAGEGYIHFWITITLMSIGYLLFAAMFEPLFLPYYFTPLLVFSGFSPMTISRTLAPVISMGVIAAMFAFYLMLAKPKNIGFPKLPANGTASPSRVSSLLKQPWDARICGLGIGLLAVIWFIYAAPFSVTNPHARWVGYVLANTVGREWVESNVYWKSIIFADRGLRPTADMVMLLFLVIGSFLAALWSGDFKIRKPLPRRIPNAVLGGLLMGFGARMAPGCNISNTFSGLAMLSAHSFVVSLGLLLGVYVVTHVMFREVGCAI